MDQVQEVRERTDIVDLIGGFVSLKKTGANFKSPCPFHQEKTPSFVVSPERQIWHCFGCQRGGDVFTFVMEYEHVEFPEALKMLAEKAGITLKRAFDEKNASRKETLLEINRLAGDYYHYLLMTHPIGEKARSYLEKRGISEKLWKTFQIGFAPKGANLYHYLTQKKKVKPQDIADAGLSAGMKKNVDFFQNRLIFSLCDQRGNIVGFSGRAIDTDFFGGKYINTRETEVYHKGETCFGLNVTKEEIRKKNQVMVMEGEFDVMSSYQSGVGNVIALKGTAFTKSQAKLLKRFCSKVILCLDTDNAGKDAVQRSVPVLEEEEFTIAAVVLPSGKDPDELSHEDPIAFKKALEHDEPIYDVLLELLQKKYDTSSSDGKKEISMQFLRFLTAIQNEVVREHYMKLASRSLDISLEALSKELDKVIKAQTLGKTVLPEVSPEPKKSRQEILEAYLLALLVQQEKPYLIIQTLGDLDHKVTWQLPAQAKLIDLLRSDSQYDPKNFATHLPSELISLFDTAYLQPIASFTLEEAKNEYKKTLKELLSLLYKNKMKELSSRIGQFDALGEEEKAQEVQAILAQTMQELSHIEKL